MNGLEGLETKQHINGQKEMLKKSIIHLASLKFKCSEEVTKEFLEDELNKVKLEDSMKVYEKVSTSDSLKLFVEDLKKLNNK